jgi:hypothetical protein
MQRPGIAGCCPATKARRDVVFGVLASRIANSFVDRQIGGEGSTASQLLQSVAGHAGRHLLHDSFQPFAGTTLHTVSGASPDFNLQSDSSQLHGLFFITAKPC